MKLLLITVLSALYAATVEASIIPANPITTTYALPAAPVATSYQVVSRNVNRVIVPRIPAVAYPGFAGTWGSYPYNYRFGYSYPGYPYGYGATVW